MHLEAPPQRCNKHQPAPLAPPPWWHQTGTSRQPAPLPLHLEPQSPPLGTSLQPTTKQEAFSLQTLDPIKAVPDPEAAAPAAAGRPASLADRAERPRPPRLTREEGSSVTRRLRRGRTGPDGPLGRWRSEVRRAKAATARVWAWSPVARMGEQVSRGSTLLIHLNGRLQPTESALHYVKNSLW
jgi:hypothetical protein